MEKEFEGKKLEFDQPVSSFEVAASTTIQSATGRALVDATKARITSTVLWGTFKSSTNCSTDEIQDQVPEFAPDDSLNEKSLLNPNIVSSTVNCR